MVRIAMLDESGKVTEVCEATVSPLASPLAPDLNKGGAFCEDGEVAPWECQGEVFRWIDSRGMVSQVCRSHIEADDFCRFVSASPEDV
jgi:hypothetical protein